MKRSTVLLFIMLIVCPLHPFSQAQARGKATLQAEPVGLLETALNGSSTLFYMDGRLWSCGDHGRLRLYALDSTTAQTVDSVDLGVTVHDLEEVTLDATHLYFGDFGNNGSGGFRTDLRILRLERGRLPQGPFLFDTIAFTYPDWDSAHAADYDCEAFVAYGDSLYLFTKQWKSDASAIYALPRVPGTYQATPRGRLEVDGLVTGACLLPDRRLLALCGYTHLCQPLVYLVYGFDGAAFDQGSQRRLRLANGIGVQTEGIASADGLHWYLTNEYLSRYGFTNEARLLRLDLTEQLEGYLHPSEAGMAVPGADTPRLYPNPTTHRVTLPYDDVERVTVVDASGQSLPCTSASSEIDLGELPDGTYIIHVQRHGGLRNAYTVIKQ